MNWCPRVKALPRSSVTAAASTATGFPQVEPSGDEATTIRASPVTASRWAQATWTRLTAAESTDKATEGSVFVRNSVGVVPWSKGEIAATCTMFLDGKVLPKSVDLATMMASL